MKLKLFLTGLLVSIGTLLSFAKPVSADEPTDIKGSQPKKCMELGLVTVDQLSQLIYDYLKTKFDIDFSSVDIAQLEGTYAPDVDMIENAELKLVCQHEYVFYESVHPATVWIIYDKDGNETGYGIKPDCYNLTKYTPKEQRWKTNGETEIEARDLLTSSTVWSKEYPRGSELEVLSGATVKWRHLVNITDRVEKSRANAKIRLNTITTHNGEKMGGTGGSTADIINEEHRVPWDRASTGWQEVTWTVPTTAKAGDTYCQYLTWAPSEYGGSGTGNSENNREQCVKVRAASDWSLEGTTTLNGGTSDIQVAANTCVTWTHTLKKVGPAEWGKPVSFRQLSEGETYGNANCNSGGGGLKEGSVPNLPTKNPYSLLDAPNTSVKTFSIRIPEGKTYCQKLSWTVEGDDSRNDSTKRLCASTLAVGSNEEAVSTIKACAVKQSSFGGTVEKCANGAVGATPSVDTNYTKPRDTIKFRYEVEKNAQLASRQNESWLAFPTFNQSKTVCNGSASNTGCQQTSLTPPLRPEEQARKVAEDICTLTGPNRGLAGLAPTSCTGLANSASNTYEGSGHTVVNSDLGLVKSDLTQRISLKDVKVKIHKNDPSHTYNYTYTQSRYEQTRWVPGTPGRTCGKDEENCTPIPSTPGYYDWETNYYPGQTGSYLENQHTWIEVLQDGPIAAEVSFAIPYNYNLTPALNLLANNSQRIQIGGTELAYDASFTVSPRENQEVKGSNGQAERYATATRPGTRWQVTEFYLPAGASKPSNWSNIINFNGQNYLTYTGPSLGCSFYSTLADSCQYTSNVGSLNTASDNNGFNQNNGTTQALPRTARLVQDAPIGTKYCVSAAVMDYTSHLGDSGYTQGNGYTDTMANRWIMTPPECVSIGKMPMVNILGDGLYSDGKIEGGMFKKQPTGQSNPGSFGSWTEYEAVSKGPIKTFATGAALGIGAAGVPLTGPTTTALVSENVQNGSCQIAPLTFANTTCTTTSIMNEQGRLAGAEFSHGLARNIGYRYTGRSDTKTVSGSITPSSYNTCDTAQTKNTDANGNTSCIHYVKANGNLTITAGQLNPGRTLIIESTDTITITGNLTLSNGPYTDISMIPNIMIFADAINIDNNTTRVDAWLMAGLLDGSGIINTCSNANTLQDITLTNCGNSLMVTGPIMATRMSLHRAGGADQGMPDTALASEVFFLNPSNYLWAYN